MDINVTIKIEGLELLTGAISALATAQASQITGATTAVINKAASTKKPAAKTETVAEATAQDTPTSNEASAPASTKVAEDSKSNATNVAKPEVNEEPKTTEAATGAASPTSISDEDLRAAATTAARKDKTKVLALVNKYAANVSAIAAADRPAFLKELETV